MSDPVKDITQAVEDIQRDDELEKDFQLRAGEMEGFYQQMLSLGVARKEDYNIISTGELSKLEVSFLVG